MKLLVTGGAGFIGSEFVRQALAAGHEVAVLDKLTYAGDRARFEGRDADLRFYQGDVGNVELVRHVFTAERPQAVVHWAAETHVDRSILDASPFMDTNVRGTQVMLDAARAAGVERFVNVATDEVYGDLGADGVFTEATPLSPNSPYAVSKTAADMLGRAYHRTWGLPVITVRPSNNYGPWQYPEKLLPVVVTKALHGERIPVYGKGENVREWLHVTDCCAAVHAVLAKGKPGEAYNIGSGMERRNLDVVKAILAQLGKGEELIEYVKDRPGHDFRYALATDKIQRELGWRAQVRFEDGLAATVQWYLEHRDWVAGKLDYLRQYWKVAYAR